MRKRDVLICLTAFVLGELTALAAENPGTKAGWQYLKEGDYARAERVFEQVLNSDPHDMKAWEGYRAAFQKRKSQEEGRPDDDPVTAPPAKETSKESPSEPSGPDEKPVSKPPRKKKKKLATESSDDEQSSSGASGDAAGSSGSSDSDEDRSSKESDSGERDELGKIDANMLRNSKRAKERFEKIRQELTEHYRRVHNGATEIHVTFYNKDLYRMLCERLGAEKGYTADKAQKLFAATVKDMRGQLEFYVKLSNYSSKPKKSVDISDIVKKTTLVDDEGNSYEPARWRGPKGQKLVNADAYTVWFSRRDSEGNDIMKRGGKGSVYLVISDLPYESKEVRIAFAIKKLQGGAKGASQPGIMDRIKSLWK